MAHMIPKHPRFHTTSDHEDDIFNALKDRLSDDYTVIHSFHSIQRNGKIISDCQSDFLIYHPSKGFLSIEAKYSNHIKYKSGEWRFDKKSDCYEFNDKWTYGKDNEIEIRPFEQADKASKELRKYVSSIAPEICKKTKFTFAVWFHGMNRDDIPNSGLPENFEQSLLLTKEDLLVPEDKINKIYSLNFFENQKTESLSKEETNFLFKEIIDPSFIAISTRSYTDVELEFIELLEKQKMALNFMNNEKSVTVIGGAGTGKTILAKEQAKKYSQSQENVLFLCYNWMLCEEIKKEFSNDPYVKVMTIDSFALWMCKQSEEQKVKYSNDYEKKERYRYAASVIGNMYGTTDQNGFQIPFSHLGKTYKHILVDEAQDLGRNEIEESNMIDNLQAVVLEGSEDGSFVAFYDSLQNIQSSYRNELNLPNLIKNSFCRIPLKTNCRNTEPIDSLSKKPYLQKRIIKERLYKSDVLNKVKGKKPIIHFCHNAPQKLFKCLDSIIDKIVNVDKIDKEDIAILSLTTEKNSF